MFTFVYHVTRLICPYRQVTKVDITNESSEFSRDQLQISTVYVSVYRNSFLGAIGKIAKSDY